MQRAFFTTVSAAAMLAFAPLGASAADMLSVGVGGYMQQWFGYANRDDEDEDGGWDAQSDAEIHFRGSLESDAGLKFTVHVELEGDRGSSAIDESFARVSGEFGQIEFGARDHAMVRMHSGISDVGIGLTSGDTQKWVPGTYLETAGHAIGNARKLNYISPRVSGVQIGLSYSPDDTSQAPADAPSGNDDAAWGVGLNFKQAMGDDATVTFSAGHTSRSRSNSDSFMLLTNSTSDPGMNHKDATMYMDIWNLWENQPTTAADPTMLDGKAIDHPTREDDTDTADIDESKVLNSADLRVAAANAKMKLEGRPTMSVMKSMDDTTYSNFGVAVSFGAFKFNAAYAKAGMGTSYMMDTNDGVVIDSSYTWDHDNDNCMTPSADATTCLSFDDDNGDGSDDLAAVEGVTYTANVAESAENDDPSNDNAVTQSVVKAPSKDYDVWGVSVVYTDGPMAVSLGHMTHEEDAGGERTATMLSASYTLAPGVSWRSSIFTVEDDTSHKAVTGDMNEGTGFVTGIQIGF